jgi:hypothetical protein
MALNMATLELKVGQRMAYVKASRSYTRTHFLVQRSSNLGIGVSLNKIAGITPYVVLPVSVNCISR